MLGAKWGNRFYIRPEIGYANLFKDATVRVEYIDPISSLKISIEEEVPNFLKGGLIYSFGVGLSF